MQEYIDFIRSLYPDKGALPLHEPAFGKMEEELVVDCVRSTFVSTVGKYVDEMERMVVDFTGIPYAVAIVNGTQALYLALLLAGVKAGDLVITQSLSFVATSNAIRYCGADPAFVDVDNNTMGLSPESLREFLGGCQRDANGWTHIASGRRIAAIVPMHTLGHVCQIGEIARIARESDIPLVEDAAESLGSREGETHTGSHGIMGTLSFNGNKVITTGGGGMIVTSNEALAKKAKHLSTTAKVPHPYEFMHDSVGYNFRMPNLNAALGVAQMRRLPSLLEGQRYVADQYREFFAGRSDVTFFTGRDGLGSTSNFWLNCLLFEDLPARNAFLEMTNKQKMFTRAMWKPLHTLPMFFECPRTDVPVTMDFYNRAVHCPATVPGRFVIEA